MRRYHFWLLALGLMAMTPAVTEAGWFSKKSDKPTADSKAVKSNQQVAEQIGKALRTQDLKGHDISVEYKGGVARLTGHAPSLRHKAAITKVVTGVSDVKRVDNQLRISAPQPAATARSAAQRPTAPRSAARPANPSGIQLASAEEMPHHGRVTRVPTSVPREAVQQVQHVQGMQPPAGAPIPSYGAMATPASHAVQDMPNLPTHAWPAYASHPNYAQVTYPKEYSAAAWPYIGPFYPYPQVPLGWRKAQLEWDDGYWKLNFSPRTEKWWWFLAPKNW